MWPWRSSRRAPEPPPAETAAETQAADRVQLLLLNRAHQQAAVAALGEQALTGVDIPTLLEHATIFIAQTLAAEYVSIHQLEPDGASLRTAAASGAATQWLEQRMPADAGSMGRHVLDSAEPLIVRDLRSGCGNLNEARSVRVTNTGGSGQHHSPPLPAPTTRTPLGEAKGPGFTVPEFLRNSLAVSGISLAIHLAHAPWGILQVFSKRPRSFGEDDFHFLHSVANVISTAYQRRQADEQSAKLAAFAQYNPNPVMEFDADAKLTYWNDATRALITALAKNNASELLPPNAIDIVRDCLTRNMNLLDVYVKIAGRTLNWSFFPIPTLGRVHAYATDVTERLNLEDQLRQSQKMEAIGQLAAGVAHDFNNILTIMQGLTRRLKSPDCDAEQTIEQLYDTTERAAALTRQLLAFSRRQVIQRRVLDVREITHAMSRMLQRLIGADIVLTVTNPDELPAVEADHSMMEQILLNLAVNARDAMPRGGQLLISTESVVLPDAPDSEHPYVCLQVQDTGCGMTDEVKTRIFEPFFTTKEVGKGTGLGLATVFGIVRQHQGFIDVESDVGRGTTFSILLPASDKPLPNSQPAPPTSGDRGDATPEPAAGGSETILLVEDEPLLRELAQTVLSVAGYKVLEAGESDEALSVWGQHSRDIALLVTDMVLPGSLNGRDLATELQKRKPELKVIYTTGYSSEGVDEDENLLQKPYPPELLTKTVRACLDAIVQQR